MKTTQDDPNEEAFEEFGGPDSVGEPEGPPPGPPTDEPVSFGEPDGGEPPVDVPVDFGGPDAREPPVDVQVDGEEPDAGESPADVPVDFGGPDAREPPVDVQVDGGEPDDWEAPVALPLDSEPVAAEDEPVLYIEPPQPVDAEPVEGEIMYVEPVLEMPIEDEPILVGGWSDVDVSSFDDDKELQNACKVCINAVLEASRRDGKLATPGEFKLRTVNRIESQVVSGSNYRFDVELSSVEDTAVRVLATFTAYSQPWTDTLECSNGCVKIGRMVRV
jgi:hypothetical protein